MSPSTDMPSRLGFVRTGPAAIARALRAPRVLLLVTGAMLGLAIVVVLPVHQNLGAALDRLPAAEGRFGRLLLPDLARLHPETRLELGATPLLAMVLWTFFAGGVLACVGIAGRRRASVGDFLAASGRFFFRSLRCWLIFLVGLAIWSWVSLGVCRPWLEGMLVPGGDQARTFWFDIGLNLFWLLGFADLWILRRLALARLTLTERRSALAAWVAALGLVLRRPLRVSAAYLGLFVVWALGMAAAALAVDRFLDSDRPGLTLLVGLLGFLWFQACLVGSWLLSRRLWVLTGVTTVEEAEPTVVVPRQEVTEDQPVVEVAS